MAIEVMGIFVRLWCRVRQWQACAFILVALPAYCAAPAGKVIWWGTDFFCSEYYSRHTNGVVQCNHEILSNAVSLAGGFRTGYAVRSDGTVCAFGQDTFGSTAIPPGLSNVVSVTAYGQSIWAIKEDGTVVEWGMHPVDNSLSNVTAVAWAHNGLLVLERDSSVLFNSLNDGPEAKPNPVFVDGTLLSNVTAIAHGGLILKSDGTVLSLSGSLTRDGLRSTSDEVVIVDGEPLTNIAAIAVSELHSLALRSNHTVVAWGHDEYGQSTVPPDLTNVVAIAANHPVSLALRSDGTVAAWGGNNDGTIFTPPPSLSNVVAIAAAGNFALAIITDSIPADIYIEPHGRLEEMASISDLIFKGKALSSERVTNSAFTISSMEVYKTEFEVISVFKGKGIETNLAFLHYGGWGPAGGWSGPSPPAHYTFDKGQCYLVFAAALDRKDQYYSPGPGIEGDHRGYRQIADIPRAEDDGILNTLDARPLPGASFKEAHWIELNLLLTNNASSNLYALEKLDYMSLSGREYDRWRNSEDFKRRAVLTALLPLTTNANETLASRALACFETSPTNVSLLEPFIPALIELANHAPEPNRRLDAIGALSGSHFEAVSNTLSQVLTNSEATVRSNAVRLLAGYPGTFAEEALRRAASDSSPAVRAQAADSIGTAKIPSLLAVLEKLFTDSTGPTNPLPPLSLDDLKGGGRPWGGNNNDVHTSAGYALLKFDVAQTSDILQRHLDDPGFRPQFLCKLAEDDASPWLTNLVEVLEARRTRIEHEVEASEIPQKREYLQTLLALFDTSFNCWRIIYKHLQDLPPAAFADGKMDRCLDALEKAGSTGSAEPTQLYALYKAKGLNERATRFRKEAETSAHYNLKQYFDQVDAK